jgi:hypothetical protein
MAKLAVWACGGEAIGDWYGHKIGADHWQAEHWAVRAGRRDQEMKGRCR